VVHYQYITKVDPHTSNLFSVTSEGVFLNQWGLNPLTPRQIEHCQYLQYSWQ